MALSRRSFVAGVATAAVARPFGLAAETAGRTGPYALPADRFDPWLRVDVAALTRNVEVLSGLARQRPIMAVIKNNAYGLGLTTVAAALEPLPQVMGLAVVKTEAALALRDAGVRKPVLLMGLFAEEDVDELVARDVSLALCTDDAPRRAARAAERVGKRVRAHLYLDTGMSRMGIPHHRALPWLEEVNLPGIDVQGTFMGFTEEPEFDREQLRRFESLASAARERGIRLGALHAASSNAVFHLPESHLDLVRPGMALYGAYPSDAGAEAAIAEIFPAVRLQARVVRVEQLRAGDSVSYGRNYVAERATWVATIPVGHTDGYPREAVDGARVLINDRTYPVIGAVSASHTIVELGAEPEAAIGDVVTLLGPDVPEIHPNAVASVTGRSVYDVLMHLNPTLPKVVD